jgi:hypothetical protein
MYTVIFDDEAIDFLAGLDQDLKKRIFDKVISSKLPAPKGAGVCCRGWKFTYIGHAPDLSKLLGFDFMCYLLHGAWQSIPCYIRVNGQFIPGLKVQGVLDLYH